MELSLCDLHLPNQAKSGTAQSGIRIRVDNTNRIPLSQIIRLEGFGNYTWVYVHNHSRFLVSKTLKRMGENLPEFIRIHKSHVVNQHFIKVASWRDSNTKKWSLQLLSGEILPWSRKRYRAYQTSLLNTSTDLATHAPIQSIHL